MCGIQSKVIFGVCLMLCCVHAGTKQSGLNCSCLILFLFCVRASITVFQWECSLNISDSLWWQHWKSNHTCRLWKPFACSLSNTHFYTHTHMHTVMCTHTSVVVTGGKIIIAFQSRSSLCFFKCLWQGKRVMICVCVCVCVCVRVPLYGWILMFLWMSNMKDKQICAQFFTNDYDLSGWIFPLTFSSQHFKIKNSLINWFVSNRKDSLKKWWKALNLQLIVGFLTLHKTAYGEVHLICFVYGAFIYVTRCPCQNQHQLTTVLRKV